MGDDYERQRMICLIFLPWGLFYQAFFFPPPFSWPLILRYLCISLYVT